MEDTSNWPVKNDVATLLGISPRTVERYCETGKLRTAKRLVPGRKPLVIVHPEDVAALQAQTLKPQPDLGKKRTRKPKPSAPVPETTYITRDQAAQVLGLPRPFVDELVALSARHPHHALPLVLGAPRRVPGLAPVVGALDNLPEPPARL